jgi:hypothetical protein
MTRGSNRKMCGVGVGPGARVVEKLYYYKLANIIVIL